MTPRSPSFPSRPWTLAVAAFGLVAAGASGMHLYLDLDLDSRSGPTDDRGPTAADVQSPESMLGMPGTADQTRTSDPAVVVLTPEAVSRAGIRFETVAMGRPARSWTVPGVVEANGYRSVTVTALTAGQVVSVGAELGQQVATGDVLARIQSPELAQFERTLVATRAKVLAAEQRVSRLERLTAIGAASEQELEGAHAELTSGAAELESARARLVWLGLDQAQIDQILRPDQVGSTLTIRAPASGVVTSRLANPGQNVDPTTALFTVVDLSTVWVVGDVYERDLEYLRVGSVVTVTTGSLPERSWRGRVSYVDPQIAPSTRTARVRVEVDNPGHALRLGMFAELLVEEPVGAEALLVPRAAIQTIGAADVVYVPDEEADGRFVERVVRLGRPAGDLVEVRGGLEAGVRVVTSGSFALRAERERLGLPPPMAPVESASIETAAAPATYRIAITPAGFVPAVVRVASGEPVNLIFTRQTDETCATEVVFADLGIRKALPLGEPVTVPLGLQSAGEITFLCGMSMLRGTVVVERR